MSDENKKRGDRKAIAAGRFYPASPEVMMSDLKTLFGRVSHYKSYNDIRAIISPHAGYIYSGEVAASAFASVPPDRKFSNIFIIGSSHRAAFAGASVYDKGDFITPLGRVPVNRKIAAALREGSELFHYETGVHDNEHSIEVQIPFIQYRFGIPPPIVPVLIGTGDITVIKSLASSLKPWFNNNNLFIISTDFSHYPSYSDAIETDRVTAEAILSGNPDKLTETLEKYRRADIRGLSTNMCGWAAGLTLMYLSAGKETLKYHHLLYKNSGDSQYGDKDGVVGYHSFIIVNEVIKASEMVTKVETEGSDDTFLFTDDDRAALFKAARASIVSGLERKAPCKSGNSEGSDAIRKSGGIFVTLYLNGALRGCIGRIVSSDPIIDNVAEMAYSAAFSDPRFPPLSCDEYDMIEIEISVLSPLKRVYNKDEIVIGKHGLFMRQEGRSGVLLPQVATERGWTVEEFLQHTARDKAGIGKDGWKNSELSVFETLILKENQSL
jgi:AmmeMemoRadiSam system protein B/AmmeMemoRadiSam system protein A